MTPQELRRELKQAFAEIRTELRKLRDLLDKYDKPELVGTKGES